MILLFYVETTYLINDFGFSRFQERKDYTKSHETLILVLVLLITNYVIYSSTFWNSVLSSIKQKKFDEMFSTVPGLHSLIQGNCPNQFPFNSLSYGQCLVTYNDITHLYFNWPILSEKSTYMSFSHLLFLLTTPFASFFSKGSEALYNCQLSLCTGNR